MSTDAQWNNPPRDHFIVMPEPQRYALVLRWTADPEDWKTSPEAVLGALAGEGERSHRADGRHDADRSFAGRSRRAARSAVWGVVMTSTRKPKESMDKADGPLLLARIDALQALLAVYRTHGQPIEALFKRLERTKASEDRIRAELDVAGEVLA